MIQIRLMSTHADKGNRGSTQANAISPVAATSILRRAVKRSTFTLLQIASGAAHLASLNCDL
jgi:hypothetical protein